MNDPIIQKYLDRSTWHKLPTGSVLTLYGEIQVRIDWNAKDIYFRGFCDRMRKAFGIRCSLSHYYSDLTCIMHIDLPDALVY